MPLAQSKGCSTRPSPEQKQEPICKVLDAIVLAHGQEWRPMTWVIIEGVP